MNRYLKWAGISVFVFALIANLQLALVDYGLGTNSLGYQVFAQTSSSGGGDANPALWNKTTDDCSITLSGAANTTVTIFGIKYKIPTSGSLTLTFSNAMVDCSSGATFLCTPIRSE